MGLGIGLFVRENSGHGEIEIRDQRNVNASEELTRLFDGFQRDDPSERGTWLFVCRSLVEDMGGHLQTSLDAGKAAFAIAMIPDDQPLTVDARSLNDQELGLPPMRRWSES